ncbi:MAG: bifunctional folylpolyglutamate synthase/dihydrofolate synthase [Blastocatellia bacterium]|nr:bifunctional folylpolyglutamate synthase/dihydrofolate synthase [Blastocatellia bacterium]
MDYWLALDYLYSLGHETLAMKLGLDNIDILAKSLGQPQQTYSTIHVAGTNGKGSFCASLASILTEAKIDTGLFTSPHLLDITERFQYNLKPISKTQFSNLLEKVKSQVDDLLLEQKLLSRPTFFEHITAVGFEYFRECRAKLAILEVGLGGRLDSTNIVSPILSVITSIDYDHQQYLGNTLTEIAREKAGILKPNVPALIAPQTEEAEKVIKEVAEKVQAPLIWLDTSQINALAIKDGYWEFDFSTEKENYKALKTGLRAYHQVITSALVVKASEILNQQGFNISKQNIKEGLERVVWPGRLELIKLKEFDLLFDGAHNPQGTKTLADFLVSWLKERNYSQKTLIFSVMKDKELPKMASLLFPLFDSVILLNQKDTRAIDFRQMDGKILNLAKQYFIVENVDEALKIANNQAVREKLVVVSGSLHLVGSIKQHLKNSKKPYQEKPYGL